MGWTDQARQVALPVARRVVPPVARPALRYLDLRVSALWTSIGDRLNGQADGQIPLPPPMLRYRVHGSLDRESFLDVGRACHRDLRRSLQLIGRDLDSFTSTLDFGCGCGRVLRHLGPGPLSGDVYGCDIDAEAISWCRSRMPFAEFFVNGIEPPLPFPDSKFDLIYGISVFTHLDEDLQFAWLRELKRVTQPDGIVVLTIHGDSLVETLPPDDATELTANGFLFSVETTSRFKLDGLPSCYQSAFHLKSYIMDRWTEFFAVERYVDKGMNNHQDVVVLRNS